MGDSRPPHTATSSVAHVSVAGPRPTNQDRCFTHLAPTDGSWVIAVADGIGGAQRADESGEAALAGFPARIASTAEMREAFYDAYERVHLLTPEWMLGKFSVAHETPGATLCVAAWTPEGDLVVGWMGDTLPFRVSRAPDGTRAGRALGFPHRNRYGEITSSVGGETHPSKVRFDRMLSMWSVHGEDDEAPQRSAVLIASDGVWESLLLGRSGAEEGAFLEVLGERFSSLVDPSTTDAASAANAIMGEAEAAGLHDNASVAVAVMEHDFVGPSDNAR